MSASTSPLRANAIRSSAAGPVRAARCLTSCAVAITSSSSASPSVQGTGEKPAVGRPVEAQVEHSGAEVSAGPRLDPPELTLTVPGGRRTGRSPPAPGLDPVGVDVTHQVEPATPE